MSLCDGMTELNGIPVNDGRSQEVDGLRFMTPLRTRTVSASLMLKRLSATTRQSGLSQALRQMGRIERTLSLIDWINDEQL
jgi:Transposase and inactivated derivatives, TnpA family